MRIGIDIRLIGKNQTGSEVYFFNLVKNLAAVDKKNEYFLYTDRNPETDERLHAEIKKLGLGSNFKIEAIRGTNRFWWNLWTLPNHLRKKPIDIFHTQYIAPFWLPQKTKLILTVHDISFEFFPQFIKKVDLFFLKTLIPRSIRRADKIITVSQNERDQIVKSYKVSSEKVEYTYNGVDTEKFSQTYGEERKKEIRKKYNLPEKFLLYVGTLQPRKNIPSLVEALAHLHKKHGKNDLKLVIVGNRKAHNFDKKTDTAIEKHSLSGSVIFPGWIEDEDLPIVYKLAKCFVFASLYEGFGIPIVEAMAAGLPVVSSNKSSLPEVGDDAVLFADPEDSAVFSEKIHMAVTDEALVNKLVRKGLIIAQSYSWQKTAQKTLEIYEAVQKKSKN